MDLPCKTRRRRRTGAEADRWSSIPGEILGLIADRIVSYADHVRFGAACRSWYSLAANFDKSRFGPLYMYGTDSKRVTLRDPASDTTLALDLPETAGSRCWGSPFGWMITFDPADLRFNLVNPFTGVTIALPSLPRSKSGGRRWDEIRAFLTANPDSDPDDSLVVIVSACRKLSFVRPAKHSKVWRTIRGDFNLSDLTRSGGNLYGIQNSLNLSVPVKLFSLQLDNRAPRAVQIQTLDLTPFQQEQDQNPRARSERHLVDLDGQLCLCVRYYLSHSTTDFKLFKIDLSAGNLTEIMTLGDRCLFLGNNASFSCKTKYPPCGLFQNQNQRREYVSNYVFYSYYYPWGGTLHRDMGSHNLSPKNRPFDIEVWDLLHSHKVYSRKDSSPSPLVNPLYGPLWILTSIN